mmetsp:Transcript_145798/g.254554  ORF Transcript_145798/g.254554 Transcript_145798/m.254554 type:complete len:202 (+) Transcript_145798:704-1309(+)
MMDPSNYSGPCPRGKNTTQLDMPGDSMYSGGSGGGGGDKIRTYTHMHKVAQICLDPMMHHNLCMAKWSELARHLECDGSDVCIPRWKNTPCKARKIFAEVGELYQWENLCTLVCNELRCSASATEPHRTILTLPHLPLNKSLHAWFWLPTRPYCAHSHLHLFQLKFSTKYYFIFPEPARVTSSQEIYVFYIVKRDSCKWNE